MSSPEQHDAEPATEPDLAIHLSKREREIVALIAQGLSNQEIAQHLYLSINSVKTYIRTAYRRLNVTRRSQAVIWGVRHEQQLAELGRYDALKDANLRLVRSHVGRRALRVV